MIKWMKGNSNFIRRLLDTIIITIDHRFPLLGFYSGF